MTRFVTLDIFYINESPTCAIGQRRMFAVNQWVQLEEDSWKATSLIGRTQPTGLAGTRGRCAKIYAQNASGVIGQILIFKYVW